MHIQRGLMVYLGKICIIIHVSIFCLHIYLLIFSTFSLYRSKHILDCVQAKDLWRLRLKQWEYLRVCHRKSSFNAYVERVIKYGAQEKKLTWSRRRCNWHEILWRHEARSILSSLLRCLCRSSERKTVLA